MLTSAAVAEAIDVLKYIELKTGFDDNGPAWIARVGVSKSGRTVYFNGKALKRSTQSIGGNYYDSDTGQHYWVSGVKRRGSNRHPAGSGKIAVEAAAVPELLALLGDGTLDTTRFIVTDAIKPTDASEFVAKENGRAMTRRGR